MIRSTKRSLFLFAVLLCASLLILGCPKSKSGDPDPCAGVAQCGTGSGSCLNDILTTCEPNADGCNVLVETDCADSGKICDPAGSLACVDGSGPCAGIIQCSPEGSSCDGNTLVVCYANADGCLVETENDCGAVLECTEAGGSASCTNPECPSNACDGLEDGDSWCEGEVATDCLDDGNGCLQVIEQDCIAEGGLCEIGEYSATCVVDTCEDHPGCILAIEDEPFCDDFYFLNTCVDTNSDGCLELEQTSCGPGQCFAPGGPYCDTIMETGMDCDDPIYVLMTGFSMFGDDFALDFSDDMDFTDLSCNSGAAGSSEAVYVVELDDGDILSVAAYGVGTVRNIQTACGSAEACVATSDSPDDSVLTYTASGYEVVYVIFESLEALPAAADYELVISINAECGNGIPEAGEDCDDHNLVPGDGCSANCTVE